MLSKHFSKLLGAAVAALALVALVAPAAQASTPKTGYGQFTGCPNKEENAAIKSCVHAEIYGGHFKMGNKDVPIKNPMTLIGGYNGEGTEFDFVAGGGLSEVKQEVPGGVIGLTGLDWLVNFLSLDALKLYAVTELAGDPGPPLNDPFTLPIKVHLINPVLGPNCRIGTDENPISLSLTTGTTSPPEPNEPITGDPGEFNNDTVTKILHIEEGEFVDNAFAAPGANGCTLTLLGLFPISLNSIVNVASGLPSAAGTNETKQNFNVEIVASKFVF